ncbi:unnamed protein product [Cyprideis torosa]|uniref:Uncharacterized protein n=1 Tax=Cyprideis torosa TaxID=163714 RepID=A0A7R8W8Y4_9CRUS|nr:unnamed protein product [Cyprideis torosa]CAG0883709.1 unnamed protein product [Cyprideis torosa]
MLPIELGILFFLLTIGSAVEIHHCTVTDNLAWDCRVTNTTYSEVHAVDEDLLKEDDKCVPIPTVKLLLDGRFIGVRIRGLWDRFQARIERFDQNMAAANLALMIPFLILVSIPLMVDCNEQSSCSSNQVLKSDLEHCVEDDSSQQCRLTTSIEATLDHLGATVYLDLVNTAKPNQTISRLQVQYLSASCCTPRFCHDPFFREPAIVGGRRECLIEEDLNWEAIASLSSLAIVAAAGFAWLIRRVCCRKRLSPLAPDVHPFPSLKVKGFGFPDGEPGGSEEELNDNVYVPAPFRQSSPLVSPILEVPAGGPSQRSGKKVVTAEITATAEGVATGDLLACSSRNLAPVIVPSQSAPKTGTLQKSLDLNKTFTQRTLARSSLRASSLVDVSRVRHSARLAAARNSNKEKPLPWRP